MHIMGHLLLVIVNKSLKKIVLFYLTRMSVYNTTQKNRSPYLIKEKKHMKNTPKTISTTEAEKLISSLGTHTGTFASRRKAARNQLVGLLMLEAGLRIGELSKLKVSDLLYFGKPVVSLVIRKETSKGGRERIIPLSANTKWAIENINCHFWSKFNMLDNDFAFVGRRKSQPLTTRQLRRIITDTSFSAFGRKIYPHMLRHTFASQLMRITNIRVIQELLGHKNLQTTQIYTHPNSDDLSQAINGMSNAQTEGQKISL